MLGTAKVWRTKDLGLPEVLNPLHPQHPQMAADEPLSNPAK